MNEMDYTVTLTAKELAFRARARAAGIPAMVVSMYAGALQKLVDSEPRPWVGLTDNEADEVYRAAQEQINEYWESGGSTIMFPTMLYKAIEAKLKEKNGG